jgi:catechol 2,3-dioxygenase-like lactoylglutathione lyase family enzyme
VFAADDDVHADAVIAKVECRGGNVLRLNSALLLEDWSFRLELPRSDIEIRSARSDRRFSGQEVTAVYNRRSPRPVAREIYEKEHRGLGEAEAWGVVDGLRATLAPGRWMNDAYANARATNKPLQLSRATEFGLSCPSTLVTNDPDAAYEFYEERGRDVVSKTIAQGNVVADGNLHGVFTHRLPQDLRRVDFEFAGETSSVLQERVDKVVDVRVTMVGESIFACEIHSQETDLGRTDWRRVDPRDLHHALVELPDDLNETLLGFVRSLGLVSCQIDLARDSEGSYWFLEVNPNGQWLWIELLTGASISDACAAYLCAPPSS